jgi:hypothetical protein
MKIHLTKDLEGFVIQAMFPSIGGDSFLLVSEAGDCACISAMSDRDSYIRIGTLSTVEHNEFADSYLVKAGVYTQQELDFASEMAQKEADNRQRLLELKQLARLRAKYPSNE